MCIRDRDWNVDEVILVVKLPGIIYVFQNPLTLLMVTGPSYMSNNLIDVMLVGDTPVPSNSLSSINNWCPPKFESYGFIIAHSTCPADVVALIPFAVLAVSNKLVKSTLPNPLNCLAVPFTTFQLLFVNVYPFAVNLVSSILVPKSILNDALSTSPFEWVTLFV